MSKQSLKYYISTPIEQATQKMYASNKVGCKIETRDFTVIMMVFCSH
jgi:hypothetical protein